MQTKMTTLNILSWTAERWEFVLGTSAVAFVALSVVASFGALYASKLVKQHDAERMIKLETDLSDAKRKQIEAELTLDKLQRPRDFDINDLINELKDKPKSTGGGVVYQDGDREGYLFATKIFLTLKASGWKIDAPTAVSLNTPPYSKVPMVGGPGGQAALTILHSAPDTPPEVEALTTALNRSGFTIGEMRTNINPGIVVILVWPKP
jgi:hypothetical protein